jgi:hypothetical protein
MLLNLATVIYTLLFRGTQGVFKGAELFGLEFYIMKQEKDMLSIFFLSGGM